MSIIGQSGPVISYGQNPPVAAGAPPADYNADAGPSMDYMGLGLIDPRFGYKNGGGGMGASSPAGSPLAFCFGPGVNYVTLSAVPSTAAPANIAALANVVSGTPMTLVVATGAGITVMAAALFIISTGLTVPASLAIDGLPGYTAFGQTQAIRSYNPSTMLARAVSITGVTSGTGGTFTVRGYDVYGVPMAETITVAAGANIVNGKKAFKFVSSVTPNFSDAHNYSVGVADVYGLPLAADSYGYVMTTFNNVPVTAPGFVVADATAASATTGDVRGTITVTADNAKRLQVMQGVSNGNLATLAPGVFTGLFGVSQFSA